MNKEEVLDQIELLLKETVEVLKQGKQLAEEEIPLIIQEFLTWELVSSIMWVVIGVILFLIGRYLPHMWLNDGREYDLDEKFFSRYCSRNDSGVILAYMLFILLTFISFIMVLVNLFNAIKIIIAPRVYLIEWASDLVS